MCAYVDVALPLPVPQTFTYRFEGRPPPPGSRVLVPFQRTEKVGWVLGEVEAGDIQGIRSVLDVLDRTPSLPEDLLELGHWMSRYYVAPLGLTFRAMLPAVLSDGAREVLRVTEAGRDRTTFDGLTERAAAVLDAVRRQDGDEVRVSGLRKRLGGASIWAEVRVLTGQGLLEHETRPPPPSPIKTRKVVQLVRWLPDLVQRQEVFGRAVRQRECYEFLEQTGGGCELADLQDAGGFSRAVVSGLEQKGLVVVRDEEVLRDPFGTPPPEPPLDLVANAAQQVAIERLIASLDDQDARPFLLHGVTGSGKTWVYIQLLREVVERRGRSAIVLVPEISLTPQTVSRFRAWFGDEVAVLHSALSTGERYDQWRQIRKGLKRVVVGARSALFAPLPDLGAIVVDEEHDGSYKQSEAPRYHARDVAVMRAGLSGAVCVLGSATPSLETWTNGRKGKFDVLTLPHRVEGRNLPEVHVEDLRRIGRNGGPAAHVDTVLSPRLVDAVQDRMRRGEQAILLLNRRGYASFIQCRACGGVQECPNCSVSLTFHRSRRRLMCHHCRHIQVAPDRCPDCGATDLSHRGLGTEQVERVVIETFPEARIARMDVDTTSGKWSHHEILGRVERGEVDLLLGTQMIAKGLDFPGVTLVGVINADVGLHLPDFRASERTYQLLSQVSGRTGRGPLGGEVIIQTFVPENEAIQAAAMHDADGFLEREWEARRNPPYPPHVRLVNVILSSPDRDLVAGAASRAVAWIGTELERVSGARPELVGPAPSPIERLHGRWRWHFFLRGGSVREMTRTLEGFAAAFRPPTGDVRIAIDRDPVALL